jgi:pyruvate formate-lyase/glycerol dehydratase family glycyl radical enzyme
MAEITLPDVSLRHITLDSYPSLKNLLDCYFKAVPEVCIKRPRIITQYHRKNKLFGKERISIVHKAKAYRQFLEAPNPIVRHTEAYDKELKLFAINDSSPFTGSTTTKFKGVPLYPELIALMLWPELLTLKDRNPNPFYISEKDAEELNLTVFPCWMKDNIFEIVRRRHYGRNEGPLGQDEMEMLQNMVFFLTSKVLCISHTIPDFSQAMTKGLCSMIDEALEKQRTTVEQTQRDFYEAIAEVLQGVVTYAHNLAEGARTLASWTKRPERKQQLLKIADIYEWVPANPARTFREGLTTVWMCWIAIHLENPNVGLSLGRLDQILYPLYEKDRKNGTLTVEEAVELVCYLWLKIGDHVPTMTEMGEQLFGGTGSNQAITVGGVDEEGKDAVNDLTYVMLKATELMRLRDPNLNARYYSGINTRQYLGRICEVNIQTGATPAIHNDKVVIEALKNKGDELPWARDYGIVGCVEPGSNGRHYGHSASILLNLASALELTLYNGKHRRIGVGADDPELSFAFPPNLPYPPRDFNDFKKGFELQTKWLIERAVTLNNRLGKAHQDYYPTPILSSFFKGPMDRGKDLIQGGADINSSGAAIIGLADVGDSLSAIEKWVFNTHLLSFPELLAALENNFEDKWLHTLLRNPAKTPIFGNEDKAADANVNWLVELLDRTFQQWPNYRGGHYRVGYWTMTTHAAFGKLTKALPNGRRAGENFASGITPESQLTPELTRALNSVARVPANTLSSGVALNIRFVPHDWDKATMLKRFSDTVDGYCLSGGMEIQFNITAHEDFLKAARDPDHPDYERLLVRVSGYTAYFKDLNPDMKKEIIDRTEYLLSTKKMQPHEPFVIDECPRSCP